MRYVHTSAFQTITSRRAMLPLSTSVSSMLKHEISWAECRFTLTTLFIIATLSSGRLTFGEIDILHLVQKDLVVELLLLEKIKVPSCSDSFSRGGFGNPNVLTDKDVVLNSIVAELANPLCVLKLAVDYKTVRLCPRSWMNCFIIALHFPKK